MSPKPVLYGMIPSPPVRAVLLTLHALGVDYDFQLVDTFKGDQRKPEYIKINPQHTIPTLEDEGRYIWDSHAICAYLVGKYGKDDSLYPKDLYARAVVDQRLHFEGTTLFKLMMEVAIAVLRDSAKLPDLSDKIAALNTALDFLETFLGDKPYVAGKQLTIADLSIVSSVSTLISVLPFDETKYPKISAWLKRIQALPYYAKANGEGLQLLVTKLTDKMK